MTTIFFLLAIIAASPVSLKETRRSDVPGMMVRASVDIDAAEIRLSGELRLTLSIEGPEPLDVTRPKRLLAEGGLWRVREKGLPLRELLPEKRQRWTQEYHLSPLAPGDAIQIPLNELTLRAGSPEDVQIAWSQKLSVRVITKITQPSVEELRPVTGIELFPKFDVLPDDGFAWLWLLLLLPVAFAFGMLIWKLKRKAPTFQTYDSAWVAEQLRRSLTTDELVRTFRLFLNHRFAKSFESDTSAELVSKLRELSEIHPDLIQLVDEFLSASDAERFAGDSRSSSQLRDQLRAIVEKLSPPPSVR